jgi:DNA-directed RNA polymerase specialized sigma24 family protein
MLNMERGINMSEKSHYWDWVRSHSFRDDSGAYVEFPEANPDVLSDDSLYWNLDEEENVSDRKAFLQRFASKFNKLTKRQRAVMFALDACKTQEKAAKALGVSQQVIQKTLKIVQKKLLQMGVFEPPRENT